MTAYMKNIITIRRATYGRAWNEQKTRMKVLNTQKGSDKGATGVLG